MTETTTTTHKIGDRIWHSGNTYVFAGWTAGCARFEHLTASSTLFMYAHQLDSLAWK